MARLRGSGTLLAIMLGSVAPAHAEDPAPTPPPPTPFDRGRVSLSGGAGSQTTFGAHYIVIGAGVGYFVLDGLELELAGLHEFGSGPSISQIQPGVRYLAHPLIGRSPLIPYVGGFYKHAFIGDPYVDVDSVGARAGLVYVSGSVVLGLGAVFEHTVSSCTMDCDSVYPDVIISLSL